MIAAAITDRALVDAMEFDRTSAAELRVRVENALLAESRLKRVKALEMKKHGDMPFAAQEREAYASEAYESAIMEQAKAAAGLEELKAARAHARLTIEIWRTIETSHRAISRYP